MKYRLRKLSCLYNFLLLVLVALIVPWTVLPDLVSIPFYTRIAKPALHKLPGESMSDLFVLSRTCCLGWFGDTRFDSFCNIWWYGTTLCLKGVINIFEKSSLVQQFAKIIFWCNNFLKDGLVHNFTKKYDLVQKFVQGVFFWPVRPNKMTKCQITCKSLQKSS